MFTSYPGSKTYFSHIDISPSSPHLLSHGRKIVLAIAEGARDISQLAVSLEALQTLHAYQLRIHPSNFKVPVIPPPMPNNHTKFEKEFSAQQVLKNPFMFCPLPKLHFPGSNNCCSLHSCSHTVCSSLWPVTWAKSSHQRPTQQWISTCQLLQPCSLRSTDEVRLLGCEELYMWRDVNKFVVIQMHCFVKIKMLMDYFPALSFWTFSTMSRSWKH